MSSSDSRIWADLRHRQAGFALLEFLVAFVLLTAFLSAFMSALAVAMRADEQASFVVRATVLAKTKLAAAGVDYPLRRGATTDRFENGYVWLAEVRDHAQIRVNAGPPIAAFRIEVTVSDPRSNGRRSYSLSSIEIARGDRR